MKAGTARDTTMEVRSERTTTRGEDIATVYEGERLVAPPNTRPTVGDHTVLGTITDVTDIGGGTVTFVDDDGDIRSFGEVTAVKILPVVSKLRLEFEAIPSQTFSHADPIGIEQG